MNSTDAVPRQRNRSSWRWHLLLGAAAITMLLPLVFMLRTALASEDQAMAATDSRRGHALARRVALAQLCRGVGEVPFLRYYLNSMVVAAVATAGQIATSACAAYAFARLEWPGRDKLFLAYLAT